MSSTSSLATVANIQRTSRPVQRLLIMRKIRYGALLTPHHRLIMRLLRRNVLSTVACDTLDSTNLNLGSARMHSSLGVVEWRALPCTACI